MLKTQEIVDRTYLPQATVRRLMEDLNLLRLVQRVEVNGNFHWRLTKELVKLADRSGAFDGSIEQRPGED